MDETAEGTAQDGLLTYGPEGLFSSCAAEGEADAFQAGLNASNRILGSYLSNHEAQELGS